MVPTNWIPSIWTLRTPVSIICKHSFGRDPCLPNLSASFLVLTSTFCFSKVFSHFRFCCISESVRLIFQLLSFGVISTLFFSYWAPMQATFLSWILSTRPDCARVLQAYRLENQDCCFHHRQLLSVEGSLVQQLYLIFFSFPYTFCLCRGYESFSILFHIGIWLFDYSFVVILVLSRFCFSVIGFLWRPRSRRRPTQVG